jgi:hypothetical protein
MRTFDISIDQDAAVVEQGGQARLTFTVTNVSGRAVRALVKLVPADDEHTPWLALVGEAQRDLASAQTGTVVVEVKPPRDAPPGTGKFGLVVASEGNPDEDLAAAAAQFTVTQAAGPPPVRGRWRPRRWWIVAGAGVAAAVIIVLAWPAPRVLVPSVVGMGLEEAARGLRDAGCGEVTEEIVGPSPPGRRDDATFRVLEQDPAAGTTVVAGTPVRLQVEARIRVPSVIGMGFQEAAAALRDAGFAEARQESVGVPFPAAGEDARLAVCEQVPPAGAEARPATVVRLRMVPTAYAYGGAQARGGDEFGDGQGAMSSGPVTSIEVWALDLSGSTVISGYRVWYGAGRVPGRVHGYAESPAATWARWDVPGGERITRVEGQVAGEYVTQLRFFSEGGGSSPRFGRAYDAGSAAGTSVVRAFEAPDPAMGSLRTITGRGRLALPDLDGPSRDTMFAEVTPRCGLDRLFGPLWFRETQGGEPKRSACTLMGGLTRLTFHFSIEGLRPESEQVEPDGEE